MKTVDLRRWIAGGLAFGMLFLSSCNFVNSGKTSPKDSDTSDVAAGDPENLGSKAMGKYREEEYELPSVSIYAMRQMEGGNVRILTEKGFFDSSDLGETWRPVEGFVLPEHLAVICAGIEKNGGAFVSGMDLTSAENDVVTKYLLYSEDGQHKEVEIDLPAGENNGGIGMGQVISAVGNAEEGTKEDDLTIEEPGMLMDFIQGVRYQEDGTLIADTGFTVLHIRPETGEIIREFTLSEADGMVQAFDVIDGMLILQTTSGILGFSLENGESVELGDALKQQAEPSSSTNADAGIFINGAAEKYIAADPDGESGYVGNRDGLFRFTPAGSILEQLVDGEITYFGDFSYQIALLSALSDHSFLTVFVNAETGEQRLVRYIYDENASIEANTNFLVYSLYDHRAVRQALSQFRKNNPSVSATLQVGISEDSGMTEADALRKLATEIMAGNGPDFLVLDGMSIDSFVEKDLLLDLSEILERNGLSDKVYEQVTHVLQKEEEIFAIPTRFFVPYVLGEKETAKNVDSLWDFADQILSLSEKTGEPAFKESDPERLAELFYKYAAPYLIKEDGSMDEEKLKDLYEKLKNTFHLQETTEDLPIPDIGMKSEMENPTVPFNNPMQYAVPMLTNTNRLALVDTSNIDTDLAVMNSVIKKNTELSMHPFSANGQNVFVPSCIVGINAKSPLIEETERFLLTLLSEEVQASSKDFGFPVNKAAMEMIMEKPKEESNMAIGMTEEGSSEPVFLEVSFPDEITIEDFSNHVEKLDTALFSDSVIRSSVKEQALLILNEGKEIDAAVSDTVQKINLYLAEQSA